MFSPTGRIRDHFFQGLLSILLYFSNLNCLIDSFLRELKKFSSDRGILAFILYIVSHAIAKEKNCFLTRPPKIKEILNPKMSSCGWEFHQSNVTLWFCIVVTTHNSPPHRFFKLQISFFIALTPPSQPEERTTNRTNQNPQQCQ